jgi:hypothetical protein
MNGFRGKGNAASCFLFLGVLKLNVGVLQSAVLPPFAASIAYPRCRYTQQRNSEFLSVLLSSRNTDYPFQWHCRICTKLRQIRESRNHDMQFRAEPKPQLPESK